MPSSSRPTGLLTEEEYSWRWLVLAACFLIQLINGSLSYHVGVLNVAVTDYFTEAGEQTISWLMAIYGSIFALGAPIGSAVINVSSVRTCVIASGLLSLVAMVLSSFVTRIEWLFLTLPLAGLGQSLTYIGGSVGLGYYFPDKTALASGIAVTGAGMGNFVHPALTQLLIEEYTLQGAFLILGAFCLQSCALGMLIRPTSAGIRQKLERKRNKQSTSFKSSVRKAWTNQMDIFLNCRYVILVVTVFIFGVAFQGIIVYLPEYLINSKGYSAMEAATVASCLGIGTLCTRSLVGFAATDPKIGLTLMFSGMCLIGSVVCFVAEPIMEYKAGAVFVAVANGIYASSTQVLLFPLTIATLGYGKCETGFGFVLGTFGLGCLLGPPLTARIFATFGYSVLFRFSAALYLVPAVLMTQAHQNQDDKHVTTNSNNGSLVASENPSDRIFDSQHFEIIVPVCETDKEKGLSDVETSDRSICKEEIIPLREKDDFSNCDVKDNEDIQRNSHIDSNNVRCAAHDIDV